MTINEEILREQQIQVPSNLPQILKKYAKSAIRTQPKDLLLWSLHYFKALRDDAPPPVKERFEFPPRDTRSGLTPGLLKVLIIQVGNVNEVAKGTLEEKWEAICIEKKYLEELFSVGKFVDPVDWPKFVAIAACSIEKDLKTTMKLSCELLSEDYPPKLAVDTFVSLYQFLARLHPSSPSSSPSHPHGGDDETKDETENVAHENGEGSLAGEIHCQVRRSQSGTALELNEGVSPANDSVESEVIQESAPEEENKDEVMNEDGKTDEENAPEIGVPVSEEIITKVESYLRECAANQSGMVYTRNLNHFLCPPLQ